MQLNTKPKPFLKWAGGKSQLLSEISKRLPHDYEQYFEPFLGGGAVFFSFSPKQTYLLDINSELINTYCVVRDSVDELIVDLKRHIYDKDYYYSIRNIDRNLEYNNWNNIQKASRFIYLNKTCWNGLHRVNSSQQFNVPMGKYKNPKIVDEENLKACNAALQNIKILAEDFLTIESKITSRDIVYFDPPYVPLSKTANFTAYSHNGFDEVKQIELYELCSRLDARGIRFILSNSSAPLVLKLYKSFNIEFVRANRFINSSSDKRGQIPEVIVTNYEY